VTLAYCSSHVRRRFYEIAQGGNAPIADEALRRIGDLYRIESLVRGHAAEQRRAVRQDRSRAVVDNLRTWLEAQLAKVPGRSRIAEAIRYALKALAGARPLPRRRAHRDGFQPGRARNPADCVDRPAIFTP
jgi:hypothetical protein